MYLPGQDTVMNPFKKRMHFIVSHLNGSTKINTSFWNALLTPWLAAGSLEIVIFSFYFVGS